ncbi:MAG: trypsin, partial [Candidatus Arcticimaribacter sp.]
DKITEPIVISDLHISVFVLENIATTTMEMRFYNDNDRVMEGEFNFPLA